VVEVTGGVRTSTRIYNGEAFGYLRAECMIFVCMTRVSFHELKLLASRPVSTMTMVWCVVVTSGEVIIFIQPFCWQDAVYERSVVVLVQSVFSPWSRMEFL